MFPLDIPSPRAENGKEKSGDGAPKKKERLIISRSKLLVWKFVFHVAHTTNIIHIHVIVFCENDNTF